MALPFSIDPTILLKFFFDKKKMKKQEIYNYLDAIAEEAKSLAAVWQEIVSNLGEKPIDIRNNNTIKKELDKHMAINAPHYLRLEQFYRYLTEATKGKYSKELKDDFVWHLGAIMRLRNVTLEEYRDYLRKIEVPFLNDMDHLSSIQNLARAVELLHKEAATIDVLAKTIRTSNS